MADDDWFSSMDDEAPAADAPAAAGEAAPAAEGGEKAEGGGGGEAEAGEAAPGEGAAAEEAPGEDEYLDPDKLLLFKHWIRPKFLQYKCLYDYQTSYYDHVVDYLEKRDKGYNVERPRPQTWAERVLRNNSKKEHQNSSLKRTIDDIKFITHTELSGQFRNYHARQYLSKRLTTTF